MSVKSEIVRRVEAIPPDQQRHILENINRFAPAKPRGESGVALLAFAGVLDDTSANEMTDAISDCETADPREW